MANDAVQTKLDTPLHCKIYLEEPKLIMKMSAYTMDVLLNPGMRDKNMNLMSHDWKRKLTTGYDTCQDGKLTKMLHKNYATGKASSIASLPRAVDKVKEYQRDFPWHVNGKLHNNYVMNNQMPKLTNGSFNPKDHTQKKEEFLCNGMMDVKTSSEANHYNCSCTGPPTSMIQLGGINSSGYTSSKSKNSNVTWHSYRENDKDVWEDKMKENKELLKLYKTEFADPAKSDRNKSKNLYLNMNFEKDNIRYEPLTKKTREPQMPSSHGLQKPNSSRVFNEGHQNNIIRNSVVKTSEKECKKSLFSVENIIERTSNECYDVTENTDVGSPVEFQNMGPWGIKSITSLSETLGSVKNGSPMEYQNMSPWEIQDITSLSQRLSAIKNAAAKSAFSPPECPNVLIKRSEVMNGDQRMEYPNTLMKTSGLMFGLAAKNNTISQERRLQESKLFLNIPTGPTHPFKTRMKRSLAIYLGVDPEIDTIQYEPLNKNSFKTNSLPARHVSLNHYSKIHNLSRKEDRDTRVQSRKKSVYSCGYDVSSINTMLQNAKKRFKCHENS